MLQEGTGQPGSGIYQSGTWSSLEQALAYLTGLTAELVITTTLPASTTLTTPTALKISFGYSGSLVVAAGKTVTIARFGGAPEDSRAFAGSGTVVIGSKSTSELFPEWWGAVGDDTNDDTVAIQAAVASAEVNFPNVGRALVLGAKKYKITAPITITKTILQIRGAGKELSTIHNVGVGTAAFTTSAFSLFHPQFSDFTIDGDSSTGRGIDLSNITTQTYLGEFANMAIYSGEQAIYGPTAVFSTIFRNISAKSFNNHTFHLSCGPGVVFIACYAHQCGTDKAGFRFKGLINMVSCNGLDVGDIWGIFGNDTTEGTWGGDFTSNDFPDITLTDCNVESFTKRGIMVHNSQANFTMIGGKLDRNGLSSAYHSMVYWRKSALHTGCAAHFSIGRVLPGSGVPNGGGALTNAWLYSETGNQLIDESGAFATASITGIYAVPNTGLIPLVTNLIGQDSFQNSAMKISSLWPRRLTYAMTKYDVPAALTPVGAGQAIVVTGYSRVTVTPAAGASISTATFVTTLGVESDAARNGELVIEAGNANLTINNTARGGAANTFVNLSGANIVMASGQVVRYLRSITNSQWEQV